jgi:hypothetical protein
MKKSSYFPAKVKKELEKFFNKSSMSRLAKTCGFTLRRAQKITAYNFVAAFLLQCSKGVNTFSEWAGQITLLSGKPLTKQGLWERIHQGSATFARDLLRQLLLRRAFLKRKNQLFSAFKRVVLQDSTTLKLPDNLRDLFPGNRSKGVQKAVARIQSMIEIKKMQFLDFVLGAYTQNDQGAGASILEVVKKGDLLIRDLGYFSLPVLEKLPEKQVDFLSRLKYGVRLYDGLDREIDCRQLLKKGKKADGRVYVGVEHQVWVRLVMIPLPKKQVAERVRRAKKDRDKRLNHNRAYYQWISYNIFITTVGEEVWSTTEVAQAYGVRWQIEIIFKSWKSCFHLQHLLHEQCTGEHRVKTNIYLLLLFICLFMQKVYLRYSDAVQRQSGQVVSLLKLSALFFRNMVELLTLSPQRLKQQITLYGCYEQRFDRTNMTELINSF